MEVKKFDFAYPFKFNFNAGSIREAATTTVHNSMAWTLGCENSSVFEKPREYMQALIDQLVELHFTACHAGALVSKDLRKVSFSHEREAT